MTLPTVQKICPQVDKHRTMWPGLACSQASARCLEVWVYASGKAIGDFILPFQLKPSTLNEKSTRPHRRSKITRNVLYTVTTKGLKVGRRLLDGGAEDKVPEIQVYP